MASIHIIQRGKNSYRLRARWREDDGKLYEHTHTLRGTREYAEAQKRIMEESFANGKIERISKESVEGYLTGYINNRQALGKIKPTTARAYKAMIRHFTARFGDKPLVSVKAEPVKDWLTDTINALGRENAAYICAILKTAFKAAVREGLVPFNPFDKVETPSHATKSKEHVMDSEQVKALWEKSYTLSGKNGFITRLALETGLRRGELGGLQWQDISEDGRVRVRRNVVHIGSEIFTQTPKTKRSIRTIKVSEMMTEELKRERGEPGAFVIGGERTPLHPDAAARILRRALAAVGLDKEFSPHDFRHAHATHLLRQGTPVAAVSKRLGHARVTTTHDLYNHAIQDDEDDIVVSLDSILRDTHAGKGGAEGPEK